MIVSLEEQIKVLEKLKEEEYKNGTNEIESFMNYYYKSIVNELTKDKSPSFFIPKNNEIKDIGG